MWAFLIAGIVYLIGISIVLAIRPSYMFTPDGLWKEFGIEKGDEYTLCPFWLFCIVWAIVSYFLVITVYKEDADIPAMNIRNNSRQNTLGDMTQPVELPKGYYVLNNKATRLAGVPKYVYLGEEAPDV
jgi:hypothetical protein